MDAKESTATPAPGGGEQKAKSPFARLLHCLSGLRPCLRRDLAPLREKIRIQRESLRETREAAKRLKEKVRRLAEANENLKGMLANMAAEHSEAIDLLDESLRKVRIQSADNRYLVNSALPREKLRESIVRWWYAKNPGILLNMDAPKTFCDKIQRLKLTADTPLMTKLADKYAARDWVAAKIGAVHLTPLLGVWSRAEDVDFAALPRRFVLKATHGSHMIHVVQDRDSLDTDAIRTKMARWLSTNYAFKMSPQMQYANIPRKIIAEEYIENLDGELHDWKVWCFKGRAHYVEFMSRKGKRLSFVYLDREWKLAPFTYSNVHDTPLEAPPKPGS
ncbi:MAG: hypothetical protein IKE55_10435 [Kiritimatiellae bacterium]|nr:hypothetical protein [Kiritimatiellia bacterium]